MLENKDGSFKSGISLRLLNCFYLISMEKLTVQFSLITGKQNGILL